MAKQRSGTTLGVIILAVFHTIGLVGFHQQQWEPFFRMLVPFNLLLSLGILLYFHSPWKGNFITWMMIIMVAGFGIEWLGVKTGLIFGQYAYGKTLGYRWEGIPIIIAVNWFILLYCSYDIATRIAQPAWVRILLTGIFMVLMDILIEPVAIRYDYWQWKNNVVPLQNYIAWGVVSCLMAYTTHKMIIKLQNGIALPLYIIQLLFFMAFNLLL